MNDALTAAMMDNIKMKHVGAREVARYTVDNGNLDHLTEDDIYSAGTSFEFNREAIQMHEDETLCNRIMALGDHVVSSDDLHKVRRIANRMFDRAVARFKENPGADNFSFLDKAMKAHQHAEKNISVLTVKEPEYEHEACTRCQKHESGYDTETHGHLCYRCYTVMETSKLI